MLSKEDDGWGTHTIQGGWLVSEDAREVYPEDEFPGLYEAYGYHNALVWWVGNPGWPERLRCNTYHGVRVTAE